MEFEVNDLVEFDVKGTEIRGKGVILGKSAQTIISWWIVLITDRETDYMKSLPDKAIVIQENFIKKVN